MGTLILALIAVVVVYGVARRALDEDRKYTDRRVDLSGGSRRNESRRQK